MCGSELCLFLTYFFDSIPSILGYRKYPSIPSILSMLISLVLLVKLTCASVSVKYIVRDDNQA